MKEDYLHLIWSKKRLPFHQMRLADGRPFVIISQGKYNRESGPDFFYGEIILDGITWKGNIELHVKSSDWKRHRHQLDPAYDNVILHVVYEHDMEIEVQGKILPVLELKDYLDQSHYKKYREVALFSSKFTCERFLSELDPVYMESMKEKAIIDRLNRKTAFLLQDNTSGIDYGQVLYRLLGQAFGMKVNAMPFIELTNRIPLKILKREVKEYSKTMILGTSGLVSGDKESFFEQHEWEFLKKKYRLEPIPEYVWKKKGLRSSGFPIKRILQFSTITAGFDFDTAFTYLKPAEIISCLDQLFTDSGAEQTDLKFSPEVKNVVLLNSFIPFIWWFGNQKRDEELSSKAIDLLLLLKPEKNTIVLEWEVAGIKSKNAYDSQALLEIYNEFCCVKKCLSCTVGNKIMNR